MSKAVGKKTIFHFPFDIFHSLPFMRLSDAVHPAMI